MKRILRVMVSALIVAVFSLSFMGCSETGGPRSSGVAFGKGHGTPATVIEVMVIVDSTGAPIKVQFDEIFPVSYVMQSTSANNTNADVLKVYATEADVDADLKAEAAEAAKPEAERKAITTKAKYYFACLYIDGEYFVPTTKVSTTDPTRLVNGDDGLLYVGKHGTKDIDDLVTYCASDEDGIAWYYNAVTNNKTAYAKKDNGQWTIATNATTGVIRAPFTTSYNTMRKRYSTYWGTSNATQWGGLGIKGNWDMLENYLLAYGFDGIMDEGAIKNPSVADGRISVEVNGISTGATLSADAHLYLAVAKAAYDKAIANQNK